MEMIDFQLNDRFGQELELIITEICSAVNEGINGSALAKLDAMRELEKCIYKRLGMRVTFNVTENIAAIMPLYSNEYHIFIPKQWHGNVDIPDQKKFLNNLENKKGTVDIKNAKLGGFFSEYVHTVYMQFYELVKTFNMKPPEIVAILLHELGHGFYACEYSDRLATTNQVLANLSKEVAKDKTKRNPEYIYKELVKLNPETKKEMVDDFAKGDRVVPSVGVFKYTIETITHQLDNYKYDSTSFENLADNFAARFGYGPQLVTGLKKLHDIYPENAYRQFGFWITVVALIGLVALTIGLFMASSFILSFFYGYIGLALAWAMVTSAGEEGRDYTYDDIKFRYKRIRDQLVQQVKLKKYNVKDAVNIAKQIEYMDELIRNTGQYRSFLDFIMNHIRPANIKAKKSIERQQLLEDLANNSLFIQSLKLHAMAT